MELIPSLFTATVLFYWPINNSWKFGTSHEEYKGKVCSPAPNLSWTLEAEKHPVF